MPARRQPAAHAEPSTGLEATLVAALTAAADEVPTVARRIGPRFARAEARRRVQAYLRGLLSPVERKNGWQLAEAVGDRTPYALQHLCLDAGYDYDLPRFAAEHRGYTAHIRPRGEERAHAGSLDPLKRPRRWVVERLHSWLNRSRRLLVRWEKLGRTYRAFLHLACALLCFQQCTRYRTALAVSE